MQEQTRPEPTPPSRSVKKLFRVMLILGGLGVALFALLPRSSDSKYFQRQPASGATSQLLPDEEKQWRYVSNLYRKMDATGDTFKMWDSSQQDWWKYAIAFTSYGLPSLAMLDPEQRDTALYFLSVMIEKMKSKKVWEDWQQYGFGDDPICRHNIMYKGHLNLMYALYQLIGGDERYAKEYTWLTRNIVAEIRESEEKKFQGVVCEPDQYFAQCNAVGLLSLYIYDKLYGTSYRAKEIPAVLKFLNQKMRDPLSGLYWESYHPSHDVAVRQLSGYANAWTLSMLRVFDPQNFDRLYPIWKKTFVQEWGPIAFVRENPGGGASRIATLFGLMAAKEFGDVALFNKLRWTIDTLGGLHRELETDTLSYLFADNTLLNGMTLSFKMHKGWGEIISYDWPEPEGRKAPPEVGELSWREVLEKKAG